MKKKPEHPTPTPNPPPLGKVIEAIKSEPPPVKDVKSQMIAIEKIFPSPTQPRTHFSAEKQTEMENSMRSIGFTISTLLVRPEQASYFLDNGVTAEEDQGRGLFWIMKQTGLGLLQGGLEAFDSHPTREAAEKDLARLQGRYELVAGERRYRAAKAVGIVEAPCIVQDLSDREVLEIQLIENAQREDLTAMEEAIGYGRLLDLVDEKGAPVYDTKSLAARIGKSVRRVEQLRKLRVLVDDPGLKEFLTALETNVITTRHASLVARMPDAKMRAGLAKDILKPKYDEAPLSLRKAELLAQKDYMVDLRGAAFDTKDAELLPVERSDDLFKTRLRGGACTDCPFRTGNALDSFECGPDGRSELPSGMHNMCMNPSCFAAKGAVGWKRWQEDETDPARKRRALGEAECKKIYQYGDQLHWNSPFIDLADKPDSSDLKAGASAPGTWRSMLKGVEIEVLVVKDRNGRKHELVDRALAVAAIEKAVKDEGEKSIFKPESKSGNGGGNGYRQETPEERAARELKQGRENEIRVAAEDAIAAAIDAKATTGKPVPDGFWVELMEAWLDDFYGEAPQDIERRRGWEDGKLISMMKKLEPHHQLGVVVELMYRLSGGDFRTESRTMKLYGVDGKKIAKETEAALKADHKKRDAVLEEIAKLAGVATLKDKDLDGIAQALWKTSFKALRKTHEMEAVRDEIVKRSKINGTDGSDGNDGAKVKKGLSPEGRANLAAVMKARWSGRKAATKKGGKKK